MKEAMFFEKLGDNKVKCHLCRHRCIINEGKKGICRVRENRGGTLYSLVYRKLISENIDPIEKKTTFSLLFWKYRIFRSNRWMQFQMPKLPKL